jgi:RNA polymerase sigma-70 factor (ECF subfamily)
MKKEELVLSELNNTVLMAFVEKEESFLEERLKLMESAIDQLPKKNREVFLLSKKSGYKHKEIASQLDISENAIEKHISRATQSIKKWLKEKNSSLVLIFLNYMNLTIY